MNFEKYVNSRFYQLTEKLAIFILVNMIALLISTASVFLLLFPSLVAVYALLLDEINGVQHSSIIGSYVRYWKQYFKKAMMLELIVVVVVGFLSFNFYTYLSYNGLLFTIGLYVMMVLSVGLIPIITNLFLTVVYFPKLTVGESLKISFYIGYRYPMSTLYVVVAYMPLIALLWSFVNLIPFIGISICIYFALRFTKGIYNKFDYQEDMEEDVHEEIG